MSGGPGAGGELRPRWDAALNPPCASQVHPDKNEHPRAEEAFKVLRAAWDIVSNPERRKEYEM